MARAIASMRFSSRASAAQAQATAATRHDDLITVTVCQPGWIDQESRLRHRTHHITARWVGLAITRGAGQRLAILRDPVDPTLMLTSIPLTRLISVDDATSHERAAVDAQCVQRTEHRK
jgi:hypothetical protein